MPVIFTVFMVAIIGIAVAVGVSRGKKIKELRDSGVIISRKMNYAEKGEEFTSKIGSYVDLKNELERMELPCTMSGNASGQVDFSSGSYAARLYRVAFDEPSGIGIYRFEFTRWRTARYGYEDDTSMNMLMTSVEKAFLRLDPNTGVKNYDLVFKKKHSIF